MGFSPLRWQSPFACPRVEALGCFPLIVRSQLDHTLSPEWPLVPISWQAESGGGGEWSPWSPEAKPPDNCCFSSSGVSGRGGQCRPFGNPNTLLSPRPTACPSDTLKTEFQIKRIIPPPLNLLFLLYLICAIIQAKILVSPQTPSCSLLVDSYKLINHQGR